MRSRSSNMLRMFLPFFYLIFCKIEFKILQVTKYENYVKLTNKFEHFRWFNFFFNFIQKFVINFKSFPEDYRRRVKNVYSISISVLNWIHRFDLARRGRYMNEANELAPNVIQLIHTTFPNYRIKKTPFFHQFTPIMISNWLK